MPKCYQKWFYPYRDYFPENFGVKALPKNAKLNFQTTKTLSNTNVVMSSYIKREKASLPLDVLRSKTCLPQLPNS